MTAEEAAKECLRANPDEFYNDSWYLPVDLETRIVKAIQNAVEAEREACARIVTDFKSAIEAEPVKADSMSYQRKEGCLNAAIMIESQIRARSTPKALVATAELSDPALD